MTASIAGRTTVLPLSSSLGQPQPRQWQPSVAAVPLGAASDTLTLRFGTAATPDAKADDKALLNRKKAEAAKEEGNKAHYDRRYGEAIKAYRRALDADPKYVDAWFNLGHTYINVGQKDLAIEAFTRLLDVKPDDYEARINLVEQLVGQGLKNQAIAHLEWIQLQQPGFDPAKRLDGLYRLQYWAQQVGYGFGPVYQQVLQRIGEWNMARAHQWLVAYLQANPKTQESGLKLGRILSGQPPVRYVFASTTQIDHVANLAEYDHNPQDGNPVPLIRFSPEMAFAHPAVLASYWLHEGTHAEDNDAQTSLTEEQQAYRYKAEFWDWARQQARLQGIAKNQPTLLMDPNLDYALSLYRANPKELDTKVALHYRMRDPSIAAESPGHEHSPTKVPIPAPTVGS